MSQPDNYGFGEEAALLKSSAAKFFAQHLPIDRLHGLVAGSHDPERRPEAPWPQDLWPQMVELGWTSLAVPEAAGGLGMPVVAVAGLVEEMGRAALPCPLLGTLGGELCAGRMWRSRTRGARRGGRGLLCHAGHDGRTASWDPGTVDVVYDGDRLSGSAHFVQDVRKAQRLLVSADGADGVQLFWTPVAAAGVDIRSNAIVDLTRDQGCVSFDGAPAQRLGDAGARRWTGPCRQCGHCWLRTWRAPRNGSCRPASSTPGRASNSTARWVSSRP